MITDTLPSRLVWRGMAAYHNYIYHQPTNLPGEHCSCLEQRLDGHEERGGSSKEEEFVCPQAYCNEE